MTSTMDIEVPSVQVPHFMGWGGEGGIGEGSNGMIGPWPHHHILHRGGVGWGGVGWGGVGYWNDLPASHLTSASNRLTQFL